MISRALALVAAVLVGAVTPLVGVAAPHGHHDHGVPAPAKAPTGKVLPKVSFTDQSGKTVTLPDGRLWAVSFFYGNCQTVCPRIVYNVSELAKRLPAEYQAKTAFAAVTFDPGRDTPAMLPKIAERHDLLKSANVYLFSGSPEATKLATEATGFDYKPDGQGGFRHVNLLVLIDGQGRIFKHFYGLEPNLDQIAELLQSPRP